MAPTPPRSFVDGTQFRALAFVDVYTRGVHIVVGQRVRVQHAVLRSPIELGRANDPVPARDPQPKRRRRLPSRSPRSAIP